MDTRNRRKSCWVWKSYGGVTEVTEIEKSLYVDDIITWGDIKDEVVELKDTTVTVFEEAKFELHKWHSNETELEVKSEPEDEKQSNAKDRIGVEPGETKLLGLPWNTIKVMYWQESSCIGRFVTNDYPGMWKWRRMWPTNGWSSRRVYLTGVRYHEALQRFRNGLKQ